MLRAAIILAALGATLGTALDAIHSHFGATAYTSPVFFRAAWWVPPLFAGAFSIGLLFPLLERLLGKRWPPPSGAGVVLAFALFTAAYWASVAPLPWPARAAIIGGIFLVSFLLTDRTPLGFAIALAAAVGGPTVESVLVSQGLFVHHEVLAFGVPGWLPFLYMTAAPAMCGLARRLVDR